MVELGGVGVPTYSNSVVIFSEKMSCENSQKVVKMFKYLYNTRQKITLAYRSEGEVTKQ